MTTAFPSLQPLEAELTAISVATLMKQLNTEVEEHVKGLPDEAQKRVVLVARASIEEVRKECYKDKKQYVAGKERVTKLVSNLSEIVRLSNVSRAVLVAALQEFGQANMTVHEVVASLNCFAAIPEERMALFPSEFRGLINEQLDRAVPTSVLHPDASQLYQQGIEKTFSTWEAKIPKMVETVQLLQQIKAVLDPRIDATPLLSIAIRNFEDQSMPEILYGEARKIVLKFHFDEVKKAAWPFFNVFEYERAIEESKTFDAEAHRTRNKKLFERIAFPTATILFCQKLAQRKELSFGQLLALYETYTKKLQDCSTLQAVEQAILLGDDIPEVLSKSLLPDTKTEVCKDTRGYPIHLKRIDSTLPYVQIPLSTVTHSVPFKPGRPRFEGDETKKIGEISYNWCSTKGRRQTMEDVHLATSLTLMDGTTCPFFAVMDGHGTPVVAHYLKILLPLTVQAWLNVAIQEKDADLAIRNAMKIGMIQLNHLIKASFGTLLDRGGSNAICSFIFQGLLITVNVGDSRAVTSTGLQLSEDANASSGTFKKKVAKRNGSIGQEGELKDRLNDNLLTFSTFGDFAEPSLRAFAQTHILKLNQGEKLRVALVCDGVTDVLTSEEIRSKLNESPSAFKLTAYAYDEGSTDNLTALIFEIP